MKTVIEACMISKTYVCKHTDDSRKGIMRILRSEKRVIHALNEISFSVGPGEILGYLGANGAGKSTTIKLLCGIFPPTSGQMYVLGNDPYKFRRKNAYSLGIVFGQRISLSWHLPAYDSFTYLKEMYGISSTDFKVRLDQMSEKLGFGSVIDRPLRTLSLGQRMKLELAAALLHKPKVLLLDEPTIGLDILTRNALLEYISDQAREDGTAVILTSHDIAGVEKIATKLLVLNNGRMAFSGTTSALSAHLGESINISLYLEERLDSIDLPSFINAKISKDVNNPFRWEIEVKAKPDIAKVIGSIAARATIVDIHFSGSRLEDLLLRLGEHT